MCVQYRWRACGIRILLCAAGIASVHLVSGGEDSGLREPGPREAVKAFDWKPHFRQKNDCGRSSLLILARLLDRPVTYERIESVLPLDPEKGTSLAELSRAAAQLGIANRVKFVTPEEFPSLQFPVILHGNSSLKSPIGHFLIVTARTNEGDAWGTIDTDRNSYSTYPLKTVLHGFSGYVLEPVGARWRGDNGYWLIASAILLGAISYHLVWQSGAKTGSARPDDDVSQCSGTSQERPR